MGQRWCAACVAALVGILAWSGCGDGGPDAAQSTAGPAPAWPAPAAPGALPTSEPAAGSPAPAPIAPPGGEPAALPTEPATDPVQGDDTPPPAAPAGGFDHANEIVALTSGLVIAAGETLHVGPGTTFQAAAGVTLRVEGTLRIEGSAEAPVRLLGAGVPRSWEGVVIAAGGMLDAHHVEIGGAVYGIHALPGSDFVVTHADLSTSFKAAVVQSDGHFEHVAFHASGDPTFSISSEAPITDPNGTLTIVDASPTVRSSTFDSGAPLVDMIRVRGFSSPLIEHVHITDAHCGIHMEGGPNNTPVVRGAVFESLAYGVMAYATAPVIEDSVFTNNATDVGFCLGATADNVPTLSNNYYSAGAPLLDPTCVGIGTTDPAPAVSPDPVAGPLPAP